MLENRELIPLLELLNDDSGSLESLAAAFARTFARSDHFRVGLAVSSLLEDNLLTRTQRIVAFAVLFDLYKADKGGPFLPVLAAAAEAPPTPAPPPALGEAAAAAAAAPADALASE
eukprot:CAMPEP_0194585130 /NCGR_PEP_ID=MMETSP0292-20121207/17543_1 /TAXON_ID=39354 /ORGANISM="Heterosigma akashiwo, Strain CCMP2393" /LENGTH=115 /DNA_ID=CAMNT_0039440467 /DNA_START=158 /DNA_END=502 /DNA_ORIENTATION=-